MPGYKWLRNYLNKSLWDTIINPDANASINFNSSILQINFNKPLIVNRRSISFGLSNNQKNIIKRLPFL